MVSGPFRRRSGPGHKVTSRSLWLPDGPIITFKSKRLFQCGWTQTQIVALALQLSADIQRLFDLEQPVPMRFLPMLDLGFCLCFGGGLIRRDNQDIPM